MKIGLVAGMVGFAVLGAAIWFTPFGQAAILVSVLFGVGLIVHSLSGLRRRDPYDLGLLHRIHEEEANKIDERELDAYDASGNVVCLNCGEEYDSRLGLCPRCKKPQF